MKGESGDIKLYLSNTLYLKLQGDSYIKNNAQVFTIRDRKSHTPLFGMMPMKFSLEGRQMTLRSSFQELWKFRLSILLQSTFPILAYPRVFCIHLLGTESVGRLSRKVHEIMVFEFSMETRNSLESYLLSQSPSLLQL